MAKLISKTYGNALYELAVEENKVDLLTEEVECAKQALEENIDFSRLMNHPKIVKEEKIRIMEEIFKGRVSDDLIGFLKIIITNDRYNDILLILSYYIDKIKELNNIGTAYVTTAVELSDIQKKQVENKLLETTKYVRMELHFTVDAVLIGGMVIRIGDRVVDSSIRQKLNTLSKDLTKIQLA